MRAAGTSKASPTAMAQEGLVSRPPEGIVRVTRHPFLVGVALWAFLHLVAIVDMASVFFFGALLVVAAGLHDSEMLLNGPLIGTAAEAGVPGATFTLKVNVWPLSSVTVTAHG